MSAKPVSLNEIPAEVAGTPVETVSAEPRLPCPQDNCRFQYWSTKDAHGRRTPVVQYKHNSFDKPCEHFVAAWSPADGTALKAVLEEAALDASRLYCVVDEQLPLDAEAHKIVIYADRQQTLGGF